MAEKRLPRHKRSGDAPNMRLMPRDIEILKAIADYRIMRQDQIQQLFFTSRSTAQYRLSHLFHHGYVQRHFLPVYAGWSPTIYTLDKKGITLLRREHGMSKIVVWDDGNGHEFLSHTLAIHDVRVAVTIACREAGYLLVRWLSESDLKADYDRVQISKHKDDIQDVSLIPDSYFTIQTPHGNASAFLEMDMGKMSIGRFTTKIRAYIAYMRTGAYTKRYQTRSLRILTVTNSETRCTNLRIRAESVGADKRFLFTSKEAVTIQAVLHEAIWHGAGNPSPTAFIPK
jgi:hypothetical protein